MQGTTDRGSVVPMQSGEAKFYMLITMMMKENCCKVTHKHFTNNPNGFRCEDEADERRITLSFVTGQCCKKTV